LEARVGSSKMVNIPWGFHKRLIQVVVPPGVTAGKQLRLRGLGKQTMEGARGDLFLKVAIGQ
jgi:DnaJ-class molecular chaperone